MHLIYTQNYFRASFLRCSLRACCSWFANAAHRKSLPSVLWGYPYFDASLAVWIDLDWAGFQQCRLEHPQRGKCPSEGRSLPWSSMWGLPQLANSFQTWSHQIPRATRAFIWKAAVWKVRARMCPLAFSRKSKEAGATCCCAIPPVSQSCSVR